jgi:EpsI family protein
MLPGSTRLPILTVLAGAAALIAAHMPTIQTEARADSLPAARLSLQLGKWQGEEVPVPADVQKALPTARILSRSYQCPTGPAFLTIVSGSDATVLHDPHDCLSGDGWQFLEEHTRTVPAGDQDTPLRVREVIMQKGGDRAHMWYWYAVGSEIYDTTLSARLGLFRTRLTEGRGRRAEFVRLIVGGETDSGRSSAMLSDLARHVAGRGMGVQEPN